MNNKIVIINAHGFQVFRRNSFSRNNGEIILNLLVMHTRRAIRRRPRKTRIALAKYRMRIYFFRSHPSHPPLHVSKVNTFSICIHFFHYTSYESIKYSQKLAKTSRNGTAIIHAPIHVYDVQCTRHVGWATRTLSNAEVKRKL